MWGAFCSEEMKTQLSEKYCDGYQDWSTSTGGYNLDFRGEREFNLWIVDCHTFHICLTLKAHRYCLNKWIVKIVSFASGVQHVVKAVGGSVDVKIVQARGDVWSRQAGSWRFGMGKNLLNWYFLQAWKHGRKILSREGFRKMKKEIFARLNWATNSKLWVVNWRISKLDLFDSF